MKNQTTFTMPNIKIPYLMVLAFLTFQLFTACKSDDPDDDTVVLEPFTLAMELPELPGEYRDLYAPDNFEINVYESMEDWAADQNPIHTDTFDAQGRVSISGDWIRSLPFYYVDVSTPDNVLSNWVYNGASKALPSIKIEGGMDTEINGFLLTVGKKFIGSYTFVSADRFNREGAKDYTGFTLYKDFTFEITERLENGGLKTEPFLVCESDINRLSYQKDEGMPFQEFVEKCQASASWFQPAKEGEGLVELIDFVAKNQYTFKKD